MWDILGVLNKQLRAAQLQLCLRRDRRGCRTRSANSNNENIWLWFCDLFTDDSPSRRLALTRADCARKTTCLQCFLMLEGREGQRLQPGCRVFLSRIKIHDGKLSEPHAGKDKQGPKAEWKSNPPLEEVTRNPPSLGSATRVDQFLPPIAPQPPHHRLPAFCQEPCSVLGKLLCQKRLMEHLWQN